MLHIINKSFPTSDALQSCLKHALPNCTILLYENGVLNVVKQTAGSKLLQSALSQYQIYALLPDIQARGIVDRIMPDIQLIDYEGFVELVIKSKQVQPWI